MNVHPAANLMPSMTDEELAELADDIGRRGQMESIKLLDGEILDGRSRFAACEIAGMEPRVESVETDDPVAYVVSLNVKRRNTTRDQRAISAAEAWPMYETGQGARTDLGPDGAEVRTRDRLAALFGVGKNAIQDARYLLSAAPEAAAAVKAGRAGLKDAVAVAKALEGARDDADDEAVSLEKEREEAAARLARLREQTVDVDLLPAPTPEHLASRMQIEETLRRAMGPGEQKRPPEEVAAKRQWDSMLDAGDRFARQIRELPAFPADDEGGLITLQCLELARILADGSARLAAAVPKPKTLEVVNEAP